MILTTLHKLTGAPVEIKNQKESPSFLWYNATFLNFYKGICGGEDDEVHQGKSDPKNDNAIEEPTLEETKYKDEQN